MSGIRGRKWACHQTTRRGGSKISYTLGHTDGVILSKDLTDQTKRFLPKPPAVDAATRTVREVLDS